MAWDPSVLRKYNTTSHFRLLAQLRGELKDNPLLRPRAGQTVAEANLSKGLTRALQFKPAGAVVAPSRRSRRPLPKPLPLPAAPAAVAPAPGPAAAAGSAAGVAAGSASFRDRLSTVDLR